MVYNAGCDIILKSVKNRLSAYIYFVRSAQFVFSSRTAFRMAQNNNLSVRNKKKKKKFKTN